MNYYLVITKSTLSEDISADDICELSDDAYFVRSILTTKELAVKLFSSKNLGTVAKLDPFDVQGWADDDVIGTLREWWGP